MIHTKKIIHPPVVLDGNHEACNIKTHYFDHDTKACTKCPAEHSVKLSGGGHTSGDCQTDGNFFENPVEWFDKSDTKTRVAVAATTGAAALGAASYTGVLGEWMADDEEGAKDINKKGKLAALGLGALAGWSYFEGADGLAEVHHEGIAKKRIKQKEWTRTCKCRETKNRDGKLNQGDYCAKWGVFRMGDAKKAYWNPDNRPFCFTRDNCGDKNNFVGGSIHQVLRGNELHYKFCDTPKSCKQNEDCGMGTECKDGHCHPLPHTHKDYDKGWYEKHDLVPWRSEAS